jgi:hypothetical protein
MVKVSLKCTVCIVPALALICLVGFYFGTSMIHQAKYERFAMAMSQFNLLGVVIWQSEETNSTFEALHQAIVKARPDLAESADPNADNPFPAVLTDSAYERQWQWSTNGLPEEIPILWTSQKHRGEYCVLYLSGVCDFLTQDELDSLVAGSSTSPSN